MSNAKAHVSKTTIKLSNDRATKKNALFAQIMSDNKFDDTKIGQIIWCKIKNITKEFVIADAGLKSKPTYL